MTSPLVLPRAFTTYACERSLVCCRHPVRAPVTRIERPLVRAALERAESGRLIADTLDDRIAPEYPGADAPLWRQRDGDCVNLDPAARACEIHRAAGLDALPSGCRNFPRWVSALPDRVEVAFALTCPTAARLLATASGRWELVTLAADAWPYAPTVRVEGPVPWTVDRQAPLADALALREAWWEALDAARDDPAALVGVLARMAHAPLDPSASDAPALDPTLASGVAQTALAALERLPDRGAYAPVRWEAFGELAQPLSARSLLDAVDPAPALVARFASHGLQWVGVHDPRPVEPMVRLVVRRTLLVVRLVDALCARVPYPIATLFRDAYSAASYVAA